MATKADFTEEEWKTLQAGITGAGMLVAVSDAGFFDSFKEANAFAHHLHDAQQRSESALVRELVTGHDRPFGMTASPAEAEQNTVEALQASVAILQAKAPDDLPGYREVVVNVAESVAEAAKGVSDKETHALDRIREAVGAT